MEAMERLAILFGLAFLRYLPAVVLPALSPLRWAPAQIRITLAFGMAWLTVLATPEIAQTRIATDASAWVPAAFHELIIGSVFGLAVMLPQAALHTAGWLVDIQAGLSAASLFNPGGQGDAQSVLGSAIGMLGVVLFFTLDLHVELYRALVASVHVIPLGGRQGDLAIGPFMDLIGSSFLLALIVVAPVALGLFAIDVGVAYATRSMPQANVYFLVLPLKITVALLLLVVSLPFVPALMERLFHDAMARIPGMLGA